MVCSIIPPGRPRKVDRPPPSAATANGVLPVARGKEKTNGVYYYNTGGQQQGTPILVNGVVAAELARQMAERCVTKQASGEHPEIPESGSIEEQKHHLQQQRAVLEQMRKEANNKLLLLEQQQLAMAQQVADLLARTSEADRRLELADKREKQAAALLTAAINSRPTLADKLEEQLDKMNGVKPDEVDLSSSASSSSTGHPTMSSHVDKLTSELKNFLHLGQQLREAVQHLKSHVVNTEQLMVSGRVPSHDLQSQLSHLRSQLGSVRTELHSACAQLGNDMPQATLVETQQYALQLDRTVTDLKKKLAAAELAMGEERSARRSLQCELGDVKGALEESNRMLAVKDGEMQQCLDKAEQLQAEVESMVGQLEVANQMLEEERMMVRELETSRGIALTLRETVNSLTKKVDKAERALECERERSRSLQTQVYALEGQLQSVHEELAEARRICSQEQQQLSTYCEANEHLTRTVQLLGMKVEEAEKMLMAERQQSCHVQDQLNEALMQLQQARSEMMMEKSQLTVSRTLADELRVTINDLQSRVENAEKNCLVEKANAKSLQAQSALLQVELNEVKLQLREAERHLEEEREQLRHSFSTADQLLHQLDALTTDADVTAWA